jgi:hypothetical protein
MNNRCRCCSNYISLGIKAGPIKMKSVKNKMLKIKSVKLSPSQILERDGVLVLPLISPDELPDINQRFWMTLREFPEYIAEPEYYVLEAFGALGNPSSFHNLYVRELRMKAYLALRDVLEPDAHGRHLQTLFDRMCIRYKGRIMKAESWHRDMGKAKADDTFYGGWINVGDTNQYFSCDPGSHNIGLKPSGFVVSEQPEDSKRIVIPPGSLIIFYADILHEIVGHVYTEDTPRLFTSWRLTQDKSSIYPKLAELLAEQGVPTLPSGNAIRMYDNNTGRFRQPAVIKWAESLVKQCRVTTKAGKVIVKQSMDSLKRLRLPLYPQYSAEEIASLT